MKRRSNPSQLLIERTEGVPFYLEESVQTLVESSALAGSPGAYKLTQEISQIQVPATVQAILAARMDRLPPEEKRLLQTASVIGTHVPYPLLAAIAEMSEEDLNKGLSALQAAEFLYETNLFPEREFTFKHALTHEVTYGSLVQERKRALHAAIVEAIEEQAGYRLDEYIDRLAHHAFEGEVWEKALKYMRQAGEKAMIQSVFRGAASCFENCLIALKHLPKTQETIPQAIDLRLRLWNALLPFGEYQKHIELLHQSQNLAEELNDDVRKGEVLSALCAALGRAGNPDPAIETGKRALSISITLGNIKLKVLGNYYTGNAYYFSGDYPRSLEHHRNNILTLKGDLLREHFGLHHPPSVTGRCWMAWCNAELGNFSEGSALGQEAVEVGESTNRLHLLYYVAYWSRLC
jgi:predicted ATPase